MLATLPNPIPSPTANSVIFTPSTIAKAIGGNTCPSFIYQINRFCDGVLVTFRDGSQEYIPNSKIFTAFVNKRRDRASTLIICEILEQAEYLVKNSHKGTLYTVYLEHHDLRCQCPDYHNQMAVLGKGCCKHGYAVLFYLGYDSLKEYQQ